MLRKDAIPTLFENLPAYLSKTLPAERKTRRHDTSATSKLENSFRNFNEELNQDEINLSRPLFEKIRAGINLFEHMQKFSQF